VRLLLDTQVVLWWLDDAPMSRAAHAAIARASNIVCVSAASAWEIGIKVALGKLRAPDDLAELLRRERFAPLSVTVTHGLAVAELPPLHGDPFDRLLVAQARLEKLTLVTRDERLAAYGVEILAA
jgi:PIN domain nuclease of toxin-antitoxin system